MILRRFIQHVHEQNWFAVGLDVLVVIIGIYLGLQVESWDQARQDRAAGELYLSQIVEDLEYDLITHQEMLVNALTLKQRSLSDLEDMLEKGEPLQPSQVNVPFIINQPNGSKVEIEYNSFRALEFSTIFSWSYPLIRSTTYDDLQNSGKLALITNDRLRFLISDYYDNSRNSNNRIIQRITGYGSVLYKLIGGGARTAFTHTSSSDPLRFDQSGFNPNVSLQDFIIRANTEEFKEYLRAETNYTAFMFDMTQEQLDRIDNLLKILKGEIE